MDVAIVGPASHRVVIVSSGLHGVEGFAGSAVQLACLSQPDLLRSSDPLRYIFVHAINPFGFAQLRRVNEDNIDLNRNFLQPGETYTGASEGYRKLDAFLNPPSIPQRDEFFKLMAAWQILRFGMRALKESIAKGQYEFPKGLFFGGEGPAWSTRVIQQHCEQWLAGATRVIHLDIHTGLGKFGDYKLLLTNPNIEQDLAWYQNAYGANVVEALAKPGGTAYQASGVFGSWMQVHFANCEFRAIGAEFGTYGVLRILESLRAENRVHHFANSQSDAYLRAKQELLECFCPAAERWRTRLINSGLRIVQQSVQALS